jgi:hypothetical protein
VARLPRSPAKARSDSMPLWQMAEVGVTCTLVTAAVAGCTSILFQLQTSSTQTATRVDSVYELIHRIESAEQRSDERLANLQERVHTMDSKIDKLDLKLDVLQLGVEACGSLQAPNNCPAQLACGFEQALHDLRCTAVCEQDGMLCQTTW